MDVGKQGSLPAVSDTHSYRSLWDWQCLLCSLRQVVSTAALQEGEGEEEEDLPRLGEAAAAAVVEEAWCRECASNAGILML